MKLRLFLVFVLIFVAFCANAFANPFPAKNGKFSPPTGGSNNNIKYGFSYSFEQAGWYGLDARKSYIELLDKYKFDWVRLPFFWDQTLLRSDGASEGQVTDLNLDDLKFAIEQAGRRNVKVVVALGLKTPYYPEFHLPPSEKVKIKFGEVIDIKHPIAVDVLEIDRKVVEELSKYPNIAYWQVENEPFLANVDNVKIDKSLLSEEIKTVRGADVLKRPIILSTDSGSSFKKSYVDLVNLMSAGDVLGVSVYFKTKGVDLFAFNLAGYSVHITWPKWLFFPVQSWGFVSPNYQKIKEDAIKRNVVVWALEVQAEPYVRVIDDAKASNFSFGSGDLKMADDFVRDQGFDHAGFWGASFWQFREKLGDESWAKSIKQLTLRQAQGKQTDN